MSDLKALIARRQHEPGYLPPPIPVPDYPSELYGYGWSNECVMAAYEGMMAHWRTEAEDRDKLIDVALEAERQNARALLLATLKAVEAQK